MNFTRQIGSQSEISKGVNSGHLLALGDTGSTGLGTAFACGMLSVLLALGLAALADFRSYLGIASQVSGILRGQRAQSVANDGNLA
jgi:hypothetical protein